MKLEEGGSYDYSRQLKENEKEKQISQLKERPRRAKVNDFLQHWALSDENKWNEE